MIPPAPKEHWHRRICLIGNSKALTIPPTILDRLSLREGDKIRIETDGERVVWEKVR